MAIAAAGLGLYAAHLWWQVDPRLIHVRQHPVYLTGWDFFAGFLERPGGPVAYASALAAEVMAVRWAGVLVLTALAAGVVAAGRPLLAGFGRRSRWLPLLPLPMLAVLTNQYEYPVASTLGLLLAVAAAAVYLRVRTWPAWRRMALFLALAAAVYAAAGGPMLLLAVLAAVAEALAPGRPRPVRWPRGLALLCLAAGALLPMAARRWLFFVPDLAGAYTVHLPFGHVHDVAALAAAVGLYAVFPLAAVGAFLRPDAARGAAERSPRWLGGRVAAWLGRSRLVRAGAVLGGVAAAVIVTLGTLDPVERRLLVLEDHFLQERWEDVLRTALGLALSNAHLQSRLFTALAHRGHLLEACFTCPLGPDRPAPAIVEVFYGEVEYDRGSRMYLSLACVNQAEHMAYEALETMGEYPPVLKRLALMHAVKGQPEAARRYLAVLERTLWHRAWARALRRALRQDPSLADHPTAGRLRRLMPTTDRVVTPDHPAALEHALAEHPENRMAAEYLMLDALLSQQPDRVVAGVARLRRARLPRLPRHLQEAVLQYVQQTRQRRINLAGYGIDPAVVQRQQVFLRRLAQHKTDPQAAWDALARDFGDTYWFYEVFGCTAAGRRGPPVAQIAPQEARRP